MEDPSQPDTHTHTHCASAPESCKAVLIIWELTQLQSKLTSSTTGWLVNLGK